MHEPAQSRSYVRLSLDYGFLDLIYNHLFIKPTLKIATLLQRNDQRIVDGAVNGTGVSMVVLAHLANGFDRFGIDGLVNGTAWVAGRLGQLTRSMQNGKVQSYITLAVVGLLLMLWWFL